MSEPKKINDPIITPEGEARSAKRRKILAGLLTGATIVGAVLLLMALFQSNDTGVNNYDAGVVIQVDHEARQAHFEMAMQPDGQAAEDGVLLGTPLGNTYISYASEVRTYYDRLLAEKGLDGGLYGSNNFVDNGLSKALFYTFYLKNSSTTEAQPFRLECRLNQQISTLQNGSGARAYDYLRLGLFIGDNGSPDHFARYFARANSKCPTVESETDYRECISDFNTIYDDDTGKLVGRSPIYTEGDMGYAENFVLGANQNGLFDVDDLMIPAGASKRITFLAYLEGYDPDSYQEPSKNQALSFSLHIGV